MPIQLRDSGLTEYHKYASRIAEIAQTKGHNVRVFTEELRRLCKITGYNFPGMWIQAWHETAGFTSDLWLSHMNPAGLKTRSGTAYQRYYNGVDAARAFVVHMSAYAGTPTVHETLKNYRFLDTRFQTALNANIGKTFTTFGDLTGRWAEDKQYGQKIEARFKEVLGGR